MNDRKSLFYCYTSKRCRVANISSFIDEMKNSLIDGKTYLRQIYYRQQMADQMAIRVRDATAGIHMKGMSSKHGRIHIFPRHTLTIINEVITRFFARICGYASLHFKMDKDLLLIVPKPQNHRHCCGGVALENAFSIVFTKSMETSTPTTSMCSTGT